MIRVDPATSASTGRSRSAGARPASPRVRAGCGSRTARRHCEAGRPGDGPVADESTSAGGRSEVAAGGGGVWVRAMTLVAPVASAAWSSRRSSPSQVSRAAAAGSDSRRRPRRVRRHVRVDAAGALAGAALPLVERGGKPGEGPGDIVGARVAGRAVEIVPGCTQVPGYARLVAETRRLVESREPTWWSGPSGGARAR